MSKPMDALLIGLVLLVIAVASWYAWQQQRASQAWPAVQGEILAARIERTDDGSNNPETSVRYHVELEYAYVVDGQRFTGTRIRITKEGWRSEDEARMQLARYAPGSKLQVHYDPTRPASSVLEPG
ncbi:hypothetical protein C0V76_03060 [Uliginosibacterium sp. TH139]|nr:hypothetical protein C0V76_03060 [Uliginosibacterium sp. TH139]